MTPFPQLSSPSAPHRTAPAGGTNHPTLRRWRIALASSSMVVLLISLTACSDQSGKPAARSPTEVGVLTLQPERQTVLTELPGRTTAYLSADIRPQVSGIVQKRLFTEGAQVRAGQVLYQLDASSYQAAYNSAQAALAKVQAAVGTAQLNAQRNSELVKIDAVSRQVADESQAALVQAQSDQGVARAALETARINLGFARITAPIAGSISTSTVTAGALVTANQTTALTTIQQLDPLYVDVTQSSTEVLRLKSDMARGRFQRGAEGEARITLKLEDGSIYPLPGRLQFSGVSVNPGTGAVTLRAVVPNPNGLLMPGMYVRAVLEAGVNERALLVPQQSVTRNTAGVASILVVDEAGKVVKRQVEIESAVGNRWQLGSGAKTGDRVIVDGLQRIKPGDEVKPVELAAKPAGTASTPVSELAPAAPQSATPAGSAAR